MLADKANSSKLVYKLLPDKASKIPDSAWGL